MTTITRSELTALEREALELVAAGLTFLEIARRLGCGKSGARLRMQRAMRKLGAVSAPHAVLLACRAGLLDGKPQRHGDHAGYEAHRRRGENPKDCPHGCWAAEQAHKAALRARQKPQEAA